MKHSKKWLVAVTLLFMAWTVQAQTQTNILSHIKDTAACRRWVDATMQKLSLKQRIGQLFVYHTDLSTAKKKQKALASVIKDYGIGGILFSGGTVAEHVTMVNAVQAKTDIPLMITFDGEWGPAMRLKGTPSFPRNRVLGCIQNDTLIYRYGREMARQCRLLGIHVNFAPVADVDNNADNPVINIRSFGSDPSLVARKVVAYARGLEDGGVLAVCKHFPGHGDTDTDSHKSLPVLQFSRERLDSIELYPFKAAIRAGVSGMMTGHLHLPQLGTKPASLSPDVIDKLLHQELGFSGLTFTDALQMRGVPATEQTCVEAFLAGNDLLLSPVHLGKGVSAILSAVRAGEISEKEIDRRCRKILTYKYALGLSERSLPVSMKAVEELETAETTTLRKELQRAAVTVVKNTQFFLPLDLSQSGTALLTIAPSATEGHAFYQSLRQYIDVNWVYFRADSIESVKERLRPAQRMVVAVSDNDVASYDDFLSQLASEKPTVIVVFSDANAWNALPRTCSQSTAAIWAHSADRAVTDYVADILVNKDRVDGRLSVPLLADIPFGAGVTLDPNATVIYKPEDLNMDSRVLAAIDTIANEGIEAGAYPGCRVLVMRDGYTIFNKNYGHLTYEGRKPVTENTMYDLASLSKTTGTLLAIMKLYDEGKIGLIDPVGKFLPRFKGTDIENITIQSLLLHESGLPASYPFYQELIDMKTCKGGLFKRKRDSNHTLPIDEKMYANTTYKFKKEWVSDARTEQHTLQMADSMFVTPSFHAHVLEVIAQLPVKGNAYKYSDINFMLLKEVAEAVSGRPLDVYLDEKFYRPMGLQYMAYAPLRRFSKENIAPTVKYDFLQRGTLQGYVHDEAASVLGGIAGNAGLFASAQDVALVYQMLLNKGLLGDKRYLSRTTCTLFMTFKSKSSRRGLGFDKPDARNPENSPCATDAPASVFGHTGFTGTCAWADPDNGLVYVFLSNRIYPMVYGRTALGKLNIRSRIQEVIYKSLMK